MLNLIKLSSTFFRMIHECIYVWGTFYFPNSLFENLKLKLEKRFEFPEEVSMCRFFNDKKIEFFKEKCLKVQRRMVEHREELASQSSVEKKRENSIRPNKMSMNVKGHQKSQSTDQLKKPSSPAKLTKQREKEFNESMRR
jgi:hypothetical protein